MNSFIKGKILLWMILLFHIYASGQRGAIEGIIVDAQTRETMVGATVMIEGTTIGTTANLNGEFRITNIPEGVVNLRVSFISYEPLVVENIHIERGKTISLSLELEQVSQMLEGVTVTARRTTYTETSLIQSIRNSQVVTSGISAQQIARSQDSDMAQVVRRVPGITIIEDRFIVVRGLSERYNTTLLHNTLAPSMEADVRSFSFDMIPASQIDHLLVFKSPSPDLPGDFAGGAVRVITKSIPDQSGFEMSLTGQYDEGTSFSPFYGTQKASYAWTGFGSDYFALPNGFPDDLREITSDHEALQLAGQSMHNNWIPQKNKAFPGQSAALTGNLVFNKGGLRVGSITTLTYNNSRSTNDIFRSDYNAYNREENISLPLYNFQDARYSQHIKLGVLHNWGIEAGPNHSVEIVNLYNQISSYSYVNRLGDHIDFGFNMNNHAFQQIFRGLYSGQITGRHKFFDERTQLEHTYGITRSYRDMPDYRQYRTERGINYIEGLDDFQIYVPIGGAQPYFMGRFFSEMKEKGFSYGANISQKLNMENLRVGFVPEIKTGFSFASMERDFHARNIGYTQSPFFIQELRGVPIDSLFHADHINNLGGIKIDEQSNPNDSYDVSNELWAYYGMLTLPLTTQLSLVGGVRVENNRRLLNSATTAGPVNVDNTETHILPSANFSWNLTEKLLLRGGYGKTLNRPEFREQAPFGFFDFDNNWVISGNQYLKTAEINNYDLRIEYYPSLAEVFSLAGFYKEFKNAIERVVLIGAGSGGSKNFSFGNADKAFVYGAEAEIKKSLLGLTSLPFVDNLSLYFNGTLLVSEVEIGSGSRSEGRDTDPRPLQGQSPYIVNAGLFYNNINANLEINVLYNIIGKRLFTGGFTALNRPEVLSYPDVYEMPRNYLDITLSKRIIKNLNMRVKIEDILNQDVVFLQDANQDGVYDKDTDQVLRRYKPGRTVKLSLGYKF